MNAITNRRPAAPPAAKPDIPFFTDNDEARQIQDDLRALQEARDLTAAKIALIHELRQVSLTSGKTQDKHKARAQVLRKQIREAVGAKPGPRPNKTDAAVAAALTLATTGQKSVEIDQATRTVQLQQDDAILEKGQQALRARLAELRDEQSYEICKQLVSERNAQLAALYGHLAAAAEVIDGMVERGAELVLRGYIPRSDILHQPGNPNLLAAGSLRNPHSPLNAERVRLIGLQILPPDTNKE